MNALTRSIAVASLLATSTSNAQINIESWTVDGGGGRSASARFVVQGTVGQADADPLQPSVSASGRYGVTGGFWAGTRSVGPLPPLVFRNGFEG